MANPEVAQRTLERPVPILPVGGIIETVAPLNIKDIVDVDIMRQKLRGGNRDREKHSILYPYDYWRGDTVLRALATHVTLQGVISKTQHRNIHKSVPFIPPLAPSIAEFVQTTYRGVVDEPGDSIEEIVRAITVARDETPGISAIEAEMASLSITALQRQRMFFS